MALAFLFLQTGFTKDSEDVQINSRAKMLIEMKMFQWYIDNRVAHTHIRQSLTAQHISLETNHESW